jgi:hypothetical protein
MKICLYIKSDGIYDKNKKKKKPEQNDFDITHLRQKHKCCSIFAKKKWTKGEATMENLHTINLVLAYSEANFKIFIK